MSHIHINDRKYSIANLPEAARVQLRKLRYAQSEIARLQAIQDHLNTLQCNAYEKLCQILQSARAEDPPE